MIMHFEKGIQFCQNRKELDLRDFKSVSDFLDAKKPDVVILAAMTVVVMQEE